MDQAERTTEKLVRARFPEAALAFTLPEGATLGDLAVTVSQLGKRYGGPPIYVDVRLR